MSARSILGCLSAAALALGLLSACKGGDSKVTITPSTPEELDKACERIGKSCADQEKHVSKVTESCKKAVKADSKKGCPDKVLAIYHCYDKELCGGGDKVWALDDLRVLAERHDKCVAEREAAKDCQTK
jgi:hypothetical protein